MTRKPVPDAVADVLGSLAANPDEAAQRFVALARWSRKKRPTLSPDRIAQELGKAYREEVARILGQHANVLLYEDEACKDLLHKSIRVGEDVHLPSLPNLRNRASLAVRAAQKGFGEMGPELASLEIIRDGNPTMSRLGSVLLAWRLCPIDNLALIGAFEYMFRREWSSSIQFLDALLKNSISSLHRSVAHEALGALWLARSNPRQALLSFQESSKCGEDRPAPLCSWYVVSLVLGDIEEAETSGKRIEEMLGPEETNLDYCISVFDARRRHGVFRARTHPDLDPSKAVFGRHTMRIRDALS